MKKIGVLCTHPVQYHSPLFQALAKEADLIVYYCSNPDPKTQGKGFGVEFLWDTPLLDGYRYEFLDSPSKFCERKIKEGYFDFFIVFGWYYPSALQALRACRKYGVPIYARGDSQLPSRPFWIQCLKQLYFRSFLSKFDGFLAPGTRFKDYLKFFGVPERKFFFCPHCVDNDFFSKNRLKSSDEKKDARVLNGLGEKDIVFLFCGKFIEKKRPMDFLKALKLIQDSNEAVKGVLVGDGPLKEKLRKYSMNQRLNVSFLGFVNQSRIPKIYSITDCLVLPSDARETWGLVVNEVFACGVPAIVSDEAGCVEDLIEEGKTGYRFKARNAALLAEKMKAFIENKNAGINFRNAALEKIKNYSIRSAVEGILKI